MRQAEQTNTSNHHPRHLSRRQILAGIAAVPLLLAACNRPSATPISTPIALDAFPAGLGRGYPLASTSGVDNQGTGANEGALAPNFAMTLEDGSGLTLHDLQGRPRLINFWATWCGPCRIEMPEIVRAEATYSDLIVLAVNVQEEQPDIAAFAEDFNMNLLVPRDTEAEVRNAYAVRGMPTTVFIDRDNRIHTVYPGILTPSILEELLTEIV